LKTPGPKNTHDIPQYLKLELKAIKLTDIIQLLDQLSLKSPYLVNPRTQEALDKDGKPVKRS